MNTGAYGRPWEVCRWYGGGLRFATGIHLWVMTLCWAAFPPSRIGAAENPRFASQPFSVPSDQAEVDEILAAISAEILVLEGQSETQAASAPVPVVGPAAGSSGEGRETDEIEKARAAAAKELIESLRKYESLLKEFAALRVQLRSLSEAGSIGRLSEELYQIQERIKIAKDQLNERRPVVTEEELKEAESDWRIANDDLMIRQSARTEREMRIAEASVLRQAAEADLQAAQGALLEATSVGEAKVAASNREAERVMARYTIRQAQIRVSEAALRLERAKLELERDLRQADDTDQVLPALRELVSVLDDRAEKLKRIRVRSERQRVRDWVNFVHAHPESVSNLERVYWPLRLTMLDHLGELERMREHAGFADRFSEEKYHDLKSDLSGELAIWNQFISSLDRRPPEQIQERYRRIGQKVRDWQSRHVQLRESYDTSFDNRAEIELRMNELDEDLRVRIRAAREATQNDTADADFLELRQELGSAKQEFDAEVELIRQEVGSLCERLRDAVKAVAIHVETLSGIRSRLYWSYLSVNDQPIWKYQFSKSLDEWNNDSRRLKRAQDIESIKSGFLRVSRTGWVALVAIQVLGLASALWLRFRLIREADSLEERVGKKLQEENLPAVPVSDRLHFQVMRFLAGTAPVLLPGVFTWWWVKLSPVDGHVAGPLIVFVCAVFVLRSLIRTVFGATKQRYRLLPCSNVVARYYQRWLQVFLWVSLVLVPIPFVLSIREWAYYSRSYMWAVYKLIMLGLALAFLSRRQTILKVAGRVETVSHPFLLAVVSAAYPLFYLFILGLFVAQVTGYGALVTHLIAAGSATLGTIILSSLLLKYVSDLVRKLQQRIRTSAEAEAVEAAADDQRSAALAAGREVVLVDSVPSLDAELPITILVSLFRLGIWSSVIVLVLGYWGISWVDLKGWLGQELIAAGPDGRPPVTIGRGGMAALVVGASWMMSRTLRSILDTKVFPSYSNLDRGGRVAVNTVIHYLLLLLGLYFAMFLMRIPLGAVTVVLGTLGLGLGLASQPLFMNFLSGLIMLFERHVKVGDVVEVDGVLGEVTHISIRATTIKTYDNVDMVIPNAEFVGGKVINWTLNDSRIRGKITIGVSYGTDPRLVERLLLQTARDSSLVLHDPPPRVRFTEFGDSSLNFALYAWFRNVTDRWDFVTDARYRIVELFNANGIEIPFPQREFSFKEDHPLRVQVVTRGDDSKETPATGVQMFGTKSWSNDP